MVILAQGNNEINIQMMPIAVADNVQVALLNPPPAAAEWQLIIYDWNGIKVTAQYFIPISDPAIFEIPPGTIFPLRVDMLVFHNGIIDYRMQSVAQAFPFPPEWYVEAFIPDYGSYYYNVSLENFNPA